MTQPGPEPTPWLDRARALQAGDRHAEAASAWEAHLQSHPGDAPAWVQLGIARCRLDQLAESEAALRKALALDPRLADAWVNLGITLGRLDRFGEAIQAFQEGLRWDPTDLHARLALAECLMVSRRFEEGTESLEAALRLDPTCAVAHRRLVNLHTALRHPAQVIACFDRWIAMEPGNPELRWNRGLAHLLYGHFREGWEDIESRFQLTTQRMSLMEPFAQPRWTGEPFPGKTLLLHHEQGFGDTIMLIRFAALAKARGGRVVAVVSPNLVDLIATCDGLDEVLPHGAPLPDFQVHLPLMSLPRVFHVEEETIPARVPYLDVPARVPSRAALEQVLALPARPVRIGFTWFGNATHIMDHIRSMPPEHLAPLGQLPGVTWYCFQRPAPESLPLPAVPISALFQNFSDTAFALRAMDLVITVDTAVAHLAGALGIPTFLMLPWESEWRWQLDRTDSPWYPTFRLYRQPAEGDWGAVIRDILRDLTEPA